LSDKEQKIKLAQFFETRCISCMWCIVRSSLMGCGGDSLWLEYDIPGPVWEVNSEKISLLNCSAICIACILFLSGYRPFQRIISLQNHHNSNVILSIISSH